MQITGEICQLCGHPVLSEVEATACSHCHAAFHKCCLEGVPQVCIQCGEVCDAPESAASGAIGEPSLRLTEGELERPKTSWAYRFSLVVVSLAMILLPAIYVGVVGLFAYSVVWFAFHAGPVIAESKSAVIMLFLYFVPLFAGATLTFFLVKPLFAPRREQKESFALNHADAPQLFALIGWICRSLNAPIPSRIDVNCDVNAYAAFRSGFRSIFGNDIVLCIGLPVVAGLNLSQLASVIAHEYGHFSQGTGMRAHYVIRRINNWLYRVVRERDAWDMYLIHMSEGEGQDGRVQLIFYLARTGVWCGRRILWLLMAVGNLLSSFLSRQMEFDADQYALKMSGSDVFVSTTLRLQQLNLGAQNAQKQLVKKWKTERKLFDQITDFIVNRANEIPADTQERHYASAFKRKTRLFDSHPSDAERMQRARAVREPGVFHDTAPATSLFANYPELSRRLTIFFYRDLVGPGFSPQSLVSAEQDQPRAGHDYSADREHIKRYFLGIATDSRPTVIHENKAPVVRRQEMLKEEIKACRRAMEESLPQAQEALAEFTHAEARLSQATQASQLLAAGFQFDPADFGLADDDADRVQWEAGKSLQAAGAALEAFETAGKTRLTDAVQLLRAPLVAALIPNAVKLQDEARELVFVLSRLGDVFDTVLELRKDCATLEVLLRYRRDQPSAENVTSALETLCTGIQERVNTIQEHTAQIRHPFRQGSEQVLVSEYLRNREYHADPYELALREGRSHAEKLLDLYCRVLGNLVMICETVERLATSPQITAITHGAPGKQKRSHDGEDGQVKPEF